MTKILDLVNGQYVKFISSHKYEMEHLDDKTYQVIDFEDSYSYEIGSSVRQHIDYMLEDNMCDAQSRYKGYTLENFEVIYD
jgi:hypothetical protein